jgi:uncharacterized membrane protein
MSNFDLIVRAVHVVGASIWLGAAFFVAWFLMPALRDTGPDGGKVMIAVQKRGWMAAIPIIATLTVLSGIWLYRPYMGDSGNAAKTLGIGGVIAIVAYIWGAGITSPAMAKAAKLTAQLATMPDSPDKAATMATVQKLRQRGFIGARVVSVLVIASAILMTLAAYL